MAVCTNTEVFNFIGAPADVVTTQGAQITALIANMEKEFKRITGREPDVVTLTSYVLSPSDYEIYGDTLYLKGIYRDILTITALVEGGATLSVATNAGSNGYKLDARLGIIYRIGSSWSELPLDIVISGTYGLNGSSVTDVKQLIIEMVAAKSGLWKNAVQTADGTIETIRTSFSQNTEDLLKRYILREV